MESEIKNTKKDNVRSTTTIDLEVFPDYFLFCGYNSTEQETFIYDIHIEDKHINKTRFIEYIRKHIVNCNKNNIGRYVLGYNIYDYDIVLTLFLYKYLSKTTNINTRELIYIITNINHILIDFKNLSDINENINLYGHVKNNKKIDDDIKDILLRVLNYRNTLNIIDIYRINGWDNKARRASLKWLEASTFSEYIFESPYDFSNPISHYATNNNLESIKQNIQQYCLYDIKKTRDIANLTKGNIENRLFIHTLFLEKYKNAEYYQLSYINKILRCNPTQFGYLIILEKLTEFNKEKVDEIYERRKEAFPDNEEIFALRSVIKSNIELRDKQRFHHIKNKKIVINTSLGAHVIDNISEHTEETDDTIMNYTIRRPSDNKEVMEAILGLGGIHGCNEGKYESNEEYTILTFDVASYYPSLVIGNSWYPIPLDKTFVKAYKDIKEERFKYPKQHPLNRAYKDTLNSIVGFTKNRFSPCFDYRFFYSVTVNGQLLLINLTEEILEKHPDVSIIMLNTDGGEIYIKKQDKGSIINIINEFGNKHNLTFEISEYKRLVVSNVNNYIAIKSKEISKEEISKYDVPIIDSNEPEQKVLEIMKKSNGYKCIETYILKEGDKYYYEETKTKGSLYNIKVSIEDLHKNYSALIIQKAIYNYYVFGIPVISTIQSCNNPFDFVYYIRKNRNNKLYLINNVKGTKNTIDSRVIRYYICDLNKLKIMGDNAGYISRINKDGKASMLHSDNRFIQVILQENSEYDIKKEMFQHIKHQYYITQASKIINTLSNQTGQLF